VNQVSGILQNSSIPENEAAACKGVALRETSTNGVKKKKHTEKTPRFGGERHHDNPINAAVKW
jgi:hypothetical protein